MLTILKIIINQELLKNQTVKIFLKECNQVDWQQSEAINIEIYQFSI